MLRRTNLKHNTPQNTGDVAMEFWSASTLYDGIKKDIPKSKDYKDVYETAITHGDPAKFDGRNFSKWKTESKWIGLGRPYYNVWPKLTRPLSTLKLDQIKCSDLEMPISAILIRMAISDECITATTKSGGNSPLRSILVAFGVPTMSMDGRDIGKTMMMFFDFGKLIEGGGYCLDHVVPLDSQSSVEDAVFEMDPFVSDLRGIQQCDPYLLTLREPMFKALRLAVSVAVIAKSKDTQLIQPDVLSKDRQKWEETHEQAIVDRAIRRGKLGWDIGREIHCSPHWRRPHAALYHVGKGRTEHRIVFRKGVLVKRDDIIKVPTGYLDDEEECQCSGEQS